MKGHATDIEKCDWYRDVSKMLVFIRDVGIYPSPELAWHSQPMTWFEKSM